VKKIIHLFSKTDNRFSSVPLRFDRKNITSRGGLFIFAKFLDHIGLHSMLEKDLSLTLRRGGKQTKQPIINRLYSLILCITAGCFRMYEIDELGDDPQFTIGRAGLFDGVSTTFSRTLKKFRRVHVYEVTRSFSRIVKKLLVGMRMITIDLDSTVTSVYGKQEGAENYIKDFKYRYGWGKMLTDSFIANEVIFLITMLTYNLTKFYQYALLGVHERDKTIIRLRERYIYQAAVITRSGGSHRMHFARYSPLQEVNALLEAS